MRGQYDGYILSNLALCYALEGESNKASQFLNSAKYRELTSHETAVVLFNESIINLVTGNKEKALNKLAESVKLAPKTIKLYCEKSIHFKDLREEQSYQKIVDN